MQPLEGQYARPIPGRRPRCYAARPTLASRKTPLEAMLRARSCKAPTKGTGLLSEQRASQRQASKSESTSALNSASLSPIDGARNGKAHVAEEHMLR